MRYIEVFKGYPPSNAAPGVYIDGANAWLVPGNNAPSLMTMNHSLNVKEMPDNPQGGGMSEDFVLKLLAIGNNPARVHDFTK